MTRFVVGDDRSQSTLFPERLDMTIWAPPATLFKIYVYGYLNRVQSSRRLERECQRNIELVWLTGRLMPDFKTIADSGRTMARPSARSAVSSWCCADALSCSAKRALRLTAASSGPSTRETGTSLGPRCTEAGTD